MPARPLDNRPVTADLLMDAPALSALGQAAKQLKALVELANLSAGFHLICLNNCTSN